MIVWLIMILFWCVGGTGFLYFIYAAAINDSRFVLESYNNFFIRYSPVIAFSSLGLGCFAYPFLLMKGVVVFDLRDENAIVRAKSNMITAGLTMPFCLFFTIAVLAYGASLYYALIGVIIFLLFFVDGAYTVNLPFLVPPILRHFRLLVGG